MGGLLLVGGARPNFMKMAPIIRSCDKHGLEYKIIHTGQHYDYNMSEVFFKELGIPKPDYNLEVGSGTYVYQITTIMRRFEYVLQKYFPDIVVVVGDVNSTVACALVVSRADAIKLAHVEAGSRVFDKNMPEETNRIITDVVSDLLFVIENDHKLNLMNEGVDINRIHVVGDTMADNLLYMKSKISATSGNTDVMLTIHRQENTDNKLRLKNMLSAVEKLSKNVSIVFPIHPRTAVAIDKFGFGSYLKNVRCLEPLGYKEFIRKLIGVSVVITDSGGLPIEAAILGKPCVILNNKIGRRTLIECGNAVLVNDNVDLIISKTTDILKYGMPITSDMWRVGMDGKASERIVKTIIENL